MRGSFAPKKGTVRAAAAGSATKGAKSGSAGALQPHKPAAAPLPPINVRRAVLADADALAALYKEQSLLQRENCTRSFGAQRIHTIMSDTVTASRCSIVPSSLHFDSA